MQSLHLGNSRHSRLKHFGCKEEPATLRPPAARQAWLSALDPYYTSDEEPDAESDAKSNE